MHIRLCKCNPKSSQDDVCDNSEDDCKLFLISLGYNTGDDHYQNLKLLREIVTRNNCRYEDQDLW
jgi:hypothetical protein